MLSYTQWCRGTSQISREVKWKKPDINSTYFMIPFIQSMKTGQSDSVIGYSREVFGERECNGFRVWSGCVSIWGCAVPGNPSRCTSVPFSAYLLYFKRRFNYRLMKHLANTAEEVGKMGRQRKERDKCKPGCPRRGHLFQAIERLRRGRGKEGRSWPTVVLRFAQEPRQRGVTSQPLSPGNSHHFIDTLFTLAIPCIWKTCFLKSVFG